MTEQAKEWSAQIARGLVYVLVGLLLPFFVSILAPMLWIPLAGPKEAAEYAPLVVGILGSVCSLPLLYGIFKIAVPPPFPEPEIISQVRKALPSLVTLWWLFRVVLVIPSSTLGSLWTIVGRGSWTLELAAICAALLCLRHQAGVMGEKVLQARAWILLWLFVAMDVAYVAWQLLQRSYTADSGLPPPSSPLWIWMIWARMIVSLALGIYFLGLLLRFRSAALRYGASLSPETS